MTWRSYPLLLLISGDNPYCIQGFGENAFFTGAMFIFIPFLIAAALKSAQGSSTAALVITSTLIAPLLPE